MSCHETVTVSAKSVNWLKEKYPELCIKAGLCERIAGRLYTKTFTTPPAAQRHWVGLTDEEWQDFSDRYGMIIFGRLKQEIEAKLKEKNT